MKRLLKFLVLVVLLLVVGIGGLIAYTFMGRRAIVDGQEINGVRVVEDGITSLAVVTIDGRQVVLVDAGNDANGQAILAELTRRGLGPEAVSTILLTHGHQDHVAGVHLFPNAQVMALEAEVPLVEGRAGARGPVTRLFPVRPTGITVTRQLQNGDVVTVGTTVFRVYAVPGHTAGSAAYLVNGVLLMGDSADVTSAGSLQGSPWIFSDSQSDNRASLRRLEQQLVADGADIRAIVPAHSGAIEGIGALTAFVRANPQ
jgi:glyoxylase-like metal-dependent hydrolase (beta-lactamase superfamily II)